MKEWGWPDKWFRDEERHKDCPCVPKGNWVVQGGGFYQSSDWYWRRYISYRCPKCGWMVQVDQVYDPESDRHSDIKVLTVLS